MKDATLNQASKILSLFAETSNEQIQAILGSGLLADLRDGNINKVNRDEYRRLCGLNPFNEFESKLKLAFLLESVGTITILATTGKFVVRDRFVVNTKQNASVKISDVGDNFTKWFFGKIEEPISETELRYQTLRKASVDGPIIAELGGDNKAEITLTEIFALIATQSNGESGALLNNDRANIFYVKDINDMLRAVRVYWGGDGWCVYAYSVGFPRGWRDGDRVFSRNSCRTL